MGFFTALTNKFPGVFPGNQPKIPPKDADLLDFKKESLSPNLRKIIRKTQSLNIVQEEPNGERWLEYASGPALSPAARILRKSLSGTALIDLGSSERWESMYKFAKLMGVRNYIAVDKYWPTIGKSFTKRDGVSVVKSLEDKDCRILLIKADALEFLSRLKDSSCCIAANGIDGSVIQSPTYHKELARQIERIVPKGGAAFGIVSHPLSLIATNSVESPLIDGDDNPVIFGYRSMGLCMQEAQSVIPLWEDHSPICFDRLLIKK